VGSGVTSVMGKVQQKRKESVKGEKDRTKREKELKERERERKEVNRKEKCKWMHLPSKRDHVYDLESSMMVHLHLYMVEVIKM